MSSITGKGFFRTLFLSTLLVLLIVAGCGDDSKTTYTMTVGSSQTVNICFDLPLVSTATVSPMAAGIPMKYTITHDPTVTVTGLASLTGTVTTDASGQASVSFSAVVDFTGNGGASVTWEFADTSIGSGGGTQTFNSGGC